MSLCGKVIPQKPQLFGSADFRGKTTNSAAWLKVPLASETVIPELSVAEFNLTVGVFFS